MEKEVNVQVESIEEMGDVIIEAVRKQLAFALRRECQVVTDYDIGPGILNVKINFKKKKESKSGNAGTKKEKRKSNKVSKK